MLDLGQEAPTVQDSSFIRKEYYLEPPGKGASVSEWQAWQKADRQAAINAKRAFTKTQAYAEVPESGQAKALVKSGGCWRQSALVGFIGDADQGTSRVEAAIDADQERRVILARQEIDSPRRGVKSKGKNVRQAKSKRDAKRRRLGFN
jgi:hypothetical protein